MSEFPNVGLYIKQRNSEEIKELSEGVRTLYERLKKFESLTQNTNLWTKVENLTENHLRSKINLIKEMYQKHFHYKINFHLLKDIADYLMIYQEDFSEVSPELKVIKKLVENVNTDVFENKDIKEILKNQETIDYNTRSISRNQLEFAEGFIIENYYEDHFGSRDPPIIRLDISQMKEYLQKYKSVYENIWIFTFIYFLIMNLVMYILNEYTDPTIFIIFYTIFNSIGFLIFFNELDSYKKVYGRFKIITKTNSRTGQLVHYLQPPYDCVFYLNQSSDIEGKFKKCYYFKNRETEYFQQNTDLKEKIKKIIKKYA